MTIPPSPVILKVLSIEWCVLCLSSYPIYFLTVRKQAVQYGGRAEFDKMKQIYEKPKNSNAASAAMSVFVLPLTIRLHSFRIAMGATEDHALAQETLQYILTGARDQDIHTFFAGLGANFKTRRLLATFFKEQFQTVGCHCLDPSFRRANAFFCSFLRD